MKMIVGLLLAATLCSAQGLSNRRAPSWNLPDSNMKHYDLLDYRGKWLLLDFMVTNCIHCKKLSEILEKVQTKYGASKLVVLSVTITPPENTNTVAAYAKENKLSIPILFDQSQMTAVYMKITPQKPNFDTPHLFVIDPNGNIARDWGYSDATKGVLEGNDLFKELDNLMNAKK